MISLSHAVYIVPDVKEAVSFLASILGFEITVDDIAINGERFLTMGPSGPASRLELQIVESEHQIELAQLKRRIGRVEYILDVEDAALLIETARSAGLTIHREPTSASYGITAIFEDPFGYLWDVVQR